MTNPKLIKQRQHYPRLEGSTCSTPSPNNSKAPKAIHLHPDALPLQNKLPHCELNKSKMILQHLPTSATHFCLTGWESYRGELPSMLDGWNSSSQCTLDPTLHYRLPDYTIVTIHSQPDRILTRSQAPSVASLLPRPYFVVLIGRAPPDSAVACSLRSSRCRRRCSWGGLQPQNPNWNTGRVQVSHMRFGLHNCQVLYETSFP